MPFPGGTKTAPTKSTREVPPAIVSKMMGHISIAFTFELYGHLIPSAQEDIMRQLNAEQRRSDEAC